MEGWEGIHYDRSQPWVMATMAIECLDELPIVVIVDQVVPSIAPNEFDAIKPQFNGNSRILNWRYCTIKRHIMWGYYRT
jgi:hypothetical protein